MTGNSTGAPQTATDVENGRVFRGPRRFLGVRVGRFYVQIKDTRFNRPLFSERYGYGCKHITVGHWRVVLRRTRTGDGGTQ